MFIDTNVFVYARFGTAPDHVRARSGLERARQGAEPICISRQILREYLATVTRPQSWGEPLLLGAALLDVVHYGNAFDILEDGPRVTETLVALCREVPAAGKQIHDANIVATMLAAGERRLLTFNSADFRRYAGRVELVALP